MQTQSLIKLEIKVGHCVFKAKYLPSHKQAKSCHDHRGQGVPLAQLRDARPDFRHYETQSISSMAG